MHQNRREKIDKRQVLKMPKIGVSVCKEKTDLIDYKVSKNIPVILKMSTFPNFLVTSRQEDNQKGECQSKIMYGCAQIKLTNFNDIVTYNSLSIWVLI